MLYHEKNAPVSITPVMFTCVHTFFFFNDTATTEIYTLSLHDALPILEFVDGVNLRQAMKMGRFTPAQALAVVPHICRSEEHTSELQSHSDLVCRLLLEKKKSAIGVTQMVSSAIAMNAVLGILNTAFRP